MREVLILMQLNYNLLFKEWPKLSQLMSRSAQNVSYSLERQLIELCNDRNISAAIPLSDITGKWSVLFKDNILSSVHHRSRLLLARWLKWALMIHNLREELAKYTAVGVVGLVNSGKSKLVNTLFGIKVTVKLSITLYVDYPFCVQCRFPLVPLRVSAPLYHLSITWKRVWRV